MTPSFGAAFLRPGAEYPGPLISRNFTREGAAVSSREFLRIEAPLGSHTDFRAAKRRSVPRRGLVGDGRVGGGAHPARRTPSGALGARFGGDGGHHRGETAAFGEKSRGSRGVPGRNCRETTHTGADFRRSPGRNAGGGAGKASPGAAILPGKHRSPGQKQPLFGGVGGTERQKRRKTAPNGGGVGANTAKNSWSPERGVTGLQTLRVSDRSASARIRVSRVYR